MAEAKNHLGLDKYQVAVIKSNFNGTKPIRKMMEKVESKIKAADEKKAAAIKALEEKYQETVKDLVAEGEAYKNQIDLLDKFTKETTKQACGIELSSEQVMNFLDNASAFYEYKNSLQGKDMFESQPEEGTGDAFPNNLPETPEESTEPNTEE